MPKAVADAVIHNVRDEAIDDDERGAPANWTGRRGWHDVDKRRRICIRKDGGSENIDVRNTYRNSCEVNIRIGLPVSSPRGTLSTCEYVVALPHVGQRHG